MSVITLNVDEARRTLSCSDINTFVVNDVNVDIVRFALLTGFTDIVLDEHSALRVMYQRPGETEVRAKTLTYYDTDGIRKYYDWELLSADLAEKGTLNCALCILRTDTEVEEWHTTPYQIRVLGSIHTDDSDEADETITPTVAQRVAVLESMIQRVASGAPIVVASTSAMTDTEQIYVLSTDGKWYYHNGSVWTAGGEYGAVATDTTLTQSGIPADAKAVGDEIDDLKEDLKKKSGLSEEAKVALLGCFEHVAWIDGHGQDYYDALRQTLYPNSIVSITAVLQLGTNQIFTNDSLDYVKKYLTVTANYADGTQGVITSYDLSGDISTEGTKTITVSANEKTTTFECPVVWGCRLTAESGEIAVGGIVNNPLASSIGTYFEPTSTNRYSNKTFLPWEIGYDCYVEADTDLNVVASVNVFNQIAMNNVSNNQQIAMSNVGLPGWQSSNPSLTVIPNSVNNSPTKAIRVCFKTVPAEQAFSANAITEVRITRRAK